MGHHNIDAEFGKKLKDREITPGPKSWEKLQSRLDKGNKKSFSYKWMLGIAASLVAGVLILGQVYRSNLSEETPSVVENPKEIKIDNNIVREEEQNSQLAVEEFQQVFVEEENQNKAQVKNTLAPKNQLLVQISNEVEEDSEDIRLADVKELEKIEFIPSKLEDEIAAYSSKLAESKDLAEAEVDSLILMAASRISRERTSYLAGETIDANSLLWDVEMEMEQSFREKVFDIMKDGYLKARTAVANRNY